MYYTERRISFLSNIIPQIWESLKLHIPIEKQVPVE